MNCAEFQRILPDIIEGGRTAEQEGHLTSCPACSGLVSDLDAISQVARLMSASEEPSPRVWNSIEIALKREGLIRQPLREPSIVSPFAHRRGLTWLLPVAAALLVAVGVSVYLGPSRQTVIQPVGEPTMSAKFEPLPPPTNPAEDQQLLEVVGSRSPAMRATYEANLQNVNAYIQDAEQSAKADPNDEEAQQSVLDAYQQRAMVYEMALDRSLP